MSMIDRPVTVIAEVTVNRASHSPTSSLEQRGLARTTVPTAITRAPVTTVNWGTVRLWRQALRELQTVLARPVMRQGPQP